MKDKRIEINQGEITLSAEHCDFGLVYLSIENDVMESFSSIQITEKKKQELIKFLQSV